MARRSGPITIKKYANRRLYDTGMSCYVTLSDIAEMIKENVDFVVMDATSGEDITRSILTQIIAEKESKGESLLPVAFLRQLIGFYGNDVQNLLSGYLEFSLQQFTDRQTNIGKYIEESSGMLPLGQFQKMGKDLSTKNIEMFENAVKMFSPFFLNRPASQNDEEKKEQKVKELKAQMDDLKKELAKLES